MPQEVENKCCKLKNCITLLSRFTKLCLDPDVVELCIKNTGDIRNAEKIIAAEHSEKLHIDNSSLLVMVILVKEIDESVLPVLS